MKSKLNELSDQEFLQQFIELTFDPAAFNHHAHLRLAWIYLRTYGLDGALDKIPAAIKQYAEHHGAHDKFHMTLTQASIHIIQHMMSLGDFSSFDSFIEAFPQLLDNFKSLIGNHYSQQHLFSESARLQFIPPDLKAF